MSPNFAYASIMFAAGIGIPILAALNAALGTRIGSPAAAALVLFLAGVLIAFYVLTITYIAPLFGVGNAVFFVLLGQLAAAAAIDHFGLFGARVTPLSFTRAAGIALMAAGLALTQRG